MKWIPIVFCLLATILYVSNDDFNERYDSGLYYDRG